ncbi:dnaJ-like protein subfamily C member 17 [Iris pallida]|uniref:DnaJ-like protein subfamily C member 17 n=1 Tax=Iris pallida TaxID=29817 RepID=A0AAX6EL95_IRIPA|nr:dnaJ-like protein subfamily C member 17 [Iris pallida]
MAKGGGGGGEEEKEIDHYSVLGLPSGEEGSKLTQKEILKAYREQSRVRHPDKRPDDPGATADFQRLKSSFEALKDDSRRGLLDARLRAQREKLVRDSLHGAKRRRLATDLEERERAAAEQEEAERKVGSAERGAKSAAAELKKELEDFRARKANKAANSAAASAFGQEKGDESGKASLDKERMLRVSWERELGDYGAVRLREIFERFGEVEDVVIRSKGSRKKASAIVVMSKKDAAIAATHGLSGDLSNPLLVIPVQGAASNVTSTSPAYGSETVNPNIIGAGFKSYEASILEKLKQMEIALYKKGDHSGE